jgi:hypothetical protein
LVLKSKIKRSSERGLNLRQLLREAVTFPSKAQGV